MKETWANGLEPRPILLIGGKQSRIGKRVELNDESLYIYIFFLNYNLWINIKQKLFPKYSLNGSEGVTKGLFAT